MVGVGIVNLRRRLCRVTVLEGWTVCVSLSVFHHVVVLVATHVIRKRAQFVVLKLVFLTHVIVLVTTHVIRSAQYVLL